MEHLTNHSLLVLTIVILTIVTLVTIMAIADHRINSNKNRKLTEQLDRASKKNTHL